MSIGVKIYERKMAKKDSVVIIKTMDGKCLYVLWKKRDGYLYM